ncbi:MAG: hypothetical protein JXA73_19555 [Acidobacteria bacterium]|nr:hypothetical protein [Acidobacteriota bacterium]
MKRPLLGKMLAALLLVAACAWAIFMVMRSRIPEQYEVYSVFIRDSFPEWFIDSNISVIPIARDYMSCAGSWLQSSEASEKLTWLRKSHPGVSDDLLLRYYSSYLSQESLENKFRLTLPTLLVPAEELDEDKHEDYVDNFFKRYPSAPGVLRFSQVAFSSDGRLAMFEYSYELCPLCSHGGTVLMEKRSGGWRIRENFGGWVS